ncbi:GNAT family N-acetyltransferase [Undibacterium sp. CY18W]|uniref:GNAT family N-acetyltransferase n=1 Tax=Undibacterium hunanense TaxID=2762292 RepID=A0ABR6ZV46_9BURK|nr:GNAT family N-acetyltransferase [Undibacterium hunanense]MBC3919747.1 GNAT family N-acetyltransferase [Undibacterium hunanense]
MEFKNVAVTEVDTLLDMLIDLGHSDGVREIRTDRDALLDALFGPEPAAIAKFVLLQQNIVGFVIYSWKWGTFTGVRDMYMQAIYIHPDYRRQGLALGIMQHLAGIAQAYACSRIEWLTVKDKAMSRQFYDSIGATEASHMVVRRLQGEALNRLASSPAGSALSTQSTP